MKPKIGFISLGSTEFLSNYVVPQEEIIRVIENKIIRKLEDAGLRVIRKEGYVGTSDDVRMALKKMQQENVDIVVFFVAATIEPEVAIAGVKEVNKPFVVWGVGSEGGENTTSYVGSQMIVGPLKEIGKNFKYMPTLTNNLIDEVAMYAKAAAAVNKLRKSKIGMIGYMDPVHSYAIMLDQIGVNEILGPTVNEIDTLYLMKEIEKVSDADAKSFTVKLKKKFKRVEGTEELWLKTAKLYIALNNLKSQFDLDAIALKCQPELSEYYGASACLVASILIDEGTPVSCEADVNAAVLMLTLYYLTGKSTFHTDLWAFDEETGIVLCAHCGVGALSLAEDPSLIEIRSHKGDHALEEKRQFEGLFPDFWVKSGEATMASLNGRKGSYRMLVTTGEIIKPETEDYNIEKLKQTHWARWPSCLFKVPDLRKFHERIIAHHYVIIHGNWEQELREVASLLNIKYQVI